MTILGGMGGVRSTALRTVAIHFRDAQSHGRTPPGRSPTAVAGTDFAPPCRMESFVRDLRYALRGLARSPGFTAAAALAVALGVAGSSAIFSVLDSVVLRPLSAPEPDRLLRVYETSRTGRKDSFSPIDYLDLAHENGAF